MRLCKESTQLTNFHFKDLEDGQTSPRQERGEGREATDRPQTPSSPTRWCGRPTWHLDFSNIERKSRKLLCENEKPEALQFPVLNVKEDTHECQPAMGTPTAGQKRTGISLNKRAMRRPR